jgi:hypothetical protein
VTVPSAERLAQNEQLFREVNERIAGVGTLLGDPRDATAFVCECADISCTEKLVLSLDEYRNLRTRDRCYAVKHGHEVGPQVECVLEEHGDYLVVRKRVGPDAG